MYKSMSKHAKTTMQWVDKVVKWRKMTAIMNTKYGQNGYFSALCVNWFILRIDKVRMNPDISLTSFSLSKSSIADNLYEEY